MSPLPDRRAHVTDDDRRQATRRADDRHADRRQATRRADDRRSLAFQKLIARYLALMTLTAVLGVALMFWSIYAYGRGRFHFSAQTYTALSDMLCPGELLQFPVNLIVDRAPLLLEFSESWWSLDGSYTAVFGTHKQSIYTAPLTVARDWRVVVPELVPGAYEYRLAAYERTSPTRAFAVPFMVPAGCTGEAAP